MHRMSDNYYHRKWYLKQQQVPTQTVMRSIMGPLAPVYFKRMSPDLKVMVGLEPPLHGAGSEWCMPPEEILAGRHVLKPVKLKELKNLRFEGIKSLGERFRLRYFEDMVKLIQRAIVDRDNEWKAAIVESNNNEYKNIEKVEANKISKRLRAALQEFELLYRQAVSKVEDIVYTAGAKEVERVRNDVFEHMSKHYAELLEYQARTLHDHYEKMLNDKKEIAKQQFIKDVSNIRTDVKNTIHDVVYEKHLSIEKLRHSIMCKNIACQVYVALKERAECTKENETLRKDHRKTIKALQKDIEEKDDEIRLSLEQHRKRQHYLRIWKKKVCHIVKKFQMFVQYCLVQLPQQAEFFMNMEKLMLLQISKAMENPAAPSIIETEPGLKTPTPHPHPFYVFSDKGYKPDVDRKLCPIHCTSSASEMPVIVINKRCFYTACDNFEKFADKVTSYLCGHKGDDDDVFEDHNYEVEIPVKITTSQQLLELKLESSIMQILQQELPNVRELPIECTSCKLPSCFCSLRSTLPKHVFSQYPVTNEQRVYEKPERKIKTRAEELRFEREPKWESYFKFIEPKACTCATTAKKHLEDNLPPYMWRMSPYEPPELPNYQRCNLLTLKNLVKRTKGLATPPPPPLKEHSKITVGVQYSDTDFDNLCTCLSGSVFMNLMHEIEKSDSLMSVCSHKSNIKGSPEPSYLRKTPSSFATDRAYSLRRLIEDDSTEVIFRAEDCQAYEKSENEFE